MLVLMVLLWFVFVLRPGEAGLGYAMLCNYVRLGYATTHFLIHKRLTILGRAVHLCFFDSIFARGWTSAPRRFCPSRWRHRVAPSV